MVVLVVLFVLALVCVLLLCGHQHKFGEWYPAAIPTCTQLGVEKRECSCGQYETREVSLLEHSYDELVVVEEATCISNGKNKKKCLVCGFVCEEETPKTTTHNYSNTGCQDCGKWKYDIKIDKLPAAITDIHGYSCEVITADVIFQSVNGGYITINCCVVYKEVGYSPVIKCVLVRSDGTEIEVAGGLFGNSNVFYPGVPYTIIDDAFFKKTNIRLP